MSTSLKAQQIKLALIEIGVLLGTLGIIVLFAWWKG